MVMDGAVSQLQSARKIWVRMFDPLPPMKAGGIRLGTPSITTRGMGEGEMEKIGAWITEI